MYGGAPPTKRFKDQEGRANGERDYHRDRIDTEPSMVVHVRQLSAKATEADLLEALQSFGQISYVTLFRSKFMGLVEFEDVQSATKCVQYAQNNAIFVCGQPAFFNYSTSKTIQRLGLESPTPNRILVMHVQNAIYPITVETIHTISKGHGDVHRIAILRRHNLQALVEFGSIEHARSAKRALNGADIYSGCCTLKVEFAKAERVRVERNDQDQWDFTAPADFNMQSPARPEPRKSLLGGPGPEQQMANMGGGVPGGGHMVSPGRQGMMGGGYGMNAGFGGGAPGYGDQQGMMGGYQGGPPTVGAGAGAGYGPGGGGAVAMVYGLDHDNWNCDKIFNLLCLYGNVLKVKLMRSKTDTAMVEFSNAEQMHEACRNLREVDVFGDNKFTLRPSKQTELKEVREPFDLPDGTPSYRAYHASRNNRFMTPQAAAKNRIVGPCKTLHWYNAPPNVTDESMKELFGEGDAPVPVKVTVFNTRSERSSTGTLEFETTREAVEALVKINHHSLDSPSGRAPYILKLAFADSSRDSRRF